LLLIGLTQGSNFDSRKQAVRLQFFRNCFNECLCFGLITLILTFELNDVCAKLIVCGAGITFNFIVPELPTGVLNCFISGWWAIALSNWFEILAWCFAHYFFSGRFGL
jgi:hypothetical protein